MFFSVRLAMQPFYNRNGCSPDSGTTPYRIASIGVRREARTAGEKPRQSGTARTTDDEKRVTNALGMNSAPDDVRGPDFE